MVQAERDGAEEGQRLEYGYFVDNLATAPVATCESGYLRPEAQPWRRQVRATFNSLLAYPGVPHDLVGVAPGVQCACERKESPFPFSKFQPPLSPLCTMIASHRVIEYEVPTVVSFSSPPQLEGSPPTQPTQPSWALAPQRKPFFHMWVYRTGSWDVVFATPFSPSLHVHSTAGQLRGPSVAEPAWSAYRQPGLGICALNKVS